ncbi:MAG: flagellar biosynthetic protein FliO [Eubacteriales bacterium]|nr:flagellar biosynthetic protein FliO [Eubacteriales bacterium]
MLLLTSGFSTLASLFKLILLLIVFIGLLFAASWFTRWYANASMSKQNNHNIQVMESYAFGPGKTICIVKIGTKYVAVAVTKEKITVLTELTEEELDLQPQEFLKQGSFGDMFSELMKKTKKQRANRD